MFLPLKSGNMGASKQTSNDLKSKIVQHYGFRAGYKKLSHRFQLSVSIVRNIVRNWKTTGTFRVKNSQRQPTDHLQRPTTSSCCRWCHCALFNNPAHFAQGEAVRESDGEEAFLQVTPGLDILTRQGLALLKI